MSQFFHTANRLAEAIRDWLAKPEGASRRWLGKPCVWAAWLGLSLAALTPPHGAGINICWLNSCTGLPCPGCGLTRSLSCGLRGMFAESWGYHPMGLLILTLFLVVAGISLLPAATQRNLCRYIESHARLFNSLYLGFVGAFVCFGIVRGVVAYAASGVLR